MKLRSEFDKFLLKEEAKVIEYIEVLYSATNGKTGKGLQGWLEMRIEMELKYNISILDVIEAVNAYEKIKQAFWKLHSPFCMGAKRDTYMDQNGVMQFGLQKPFINIKDKEMVKKNALTITHNAMSSLFKSIKFLVDNGTYYDGIVEDTNFSQDEINELAIAIKYDNHKTFFNLLSEKIKNKSTAERYTKHIFGKAPKHQ